MKVKLAELKDKYAKIKFVVDSKKESLVEYVMIIEEYYIIIEEISEYITIMNKKPIFKEALSTEPDQIKMQIAEIEVV